MAYYTIVDNNGCTILSEASCTVLSILECPSLLELVRILRIHIKDYLVTNTNVSKY